MTERTETAEPVAVKALEWRQLTPDAWIARTEMGNYRIYLYGESDWCSFLESGPATSKASTGSLVAAKTAAQADYEARIRSALVAAPSSASEQVERPAPWANDEEKANGWTLSPKFLDKLNREIAQVTSYDTTIEVVEYAYLAGREAALSAPPALDAGTVETPISERRLAVAVAEIRQGERSSPLCEPPGEADIDIALGWVRRIEKARTALRTEKETRP